jgi:hypothetical protein
VGRVGRVGRPGLEPRMDTDEHGLGMTTARPAAGRETSRVGTGAGWGRVGDQRRDRPPSGLRTSASGSRCETTGRERSPGPADRDGCPAADWASADTRYVPFSAPDPPSPSRCPGGRPERRQVWRPRGVQGSEAADSYVVMRSPVQLFEECERLPGLPKELSVHIITKNYIYASKNDDAGSKA